MHHHRQVRRRLVYRYAKALYLGRQRRLGTRDSVLHLHLGVIQIGPQGESDGQGQLAVSGCLRGHVKHALDTGDGLFEGGRDGFADHFRVGAREAGAHHHSRRHDFGIFADRQLEQRYGATDQDDQ